jgi:dCTP deaminase
LIRRRAMILSGLEIKNKMGGDIVISPFDEKRLNPNSYNLRLHNELLVYDDDILDMKKPNAASLITVPGDGLKLLPGKLYLGRTVEYTETKSYVPMLEGRSSIGRLGMYIHVTAGFGDVGFKGYWTLEIHCVQPIIIYPFTEVCQIYYHTIEGEYIEYSSGKYQNNDGIQPSLLYKDFD